MSALTVGSEVLMRLILTDDQAVEPSGRPPPDPQVRRPRVDLLAMPSFGGLCALGPERPTVTALVAVYNGQEFLGRALDSALGQDYPAELLDLVVVDDGSTDSSPEILAGYQRSHPGRITVVRQENAGYVAATAAAVATATGQVLAILDADDVWPADKIGRQVAMLIADPSLGLVYTDTRIIDRHEKVIRESHMRSLGVSPQAGPDALRDIMGKPGNLAISSTIAVRAELARAFFPAPAGVPFQDWWLTAHVASVASIGFLAGVSTGYRQHGDNDVLGATGLRAVRASCMTAQMRRQILVHGLGEHVSEKDLLMAWQCWENSGKVAVQQSGSAYVALAPSTEAELAQGAEHGRTADEALLAGDVRRALRDRIAALACNPLDITSRQWVHDLAWVADPEANPPLTEDPLAGARRFITLAHADELISDPGLLAAYASVIGEDDDATLVVGAIGLGDNRAVNAIADTAHRAGLSLEALPDVLIVTRGGPAARVELERRAHAVLTRQRPRIAVPAFHAGQIGQLRELVAA
jgi:hypothetical protein